MVVHISSCLDKHTSRTAGGVEEHLVAGSRLQHLHHISNNRGGGIEGTAVLTFLQGEVAQEEFINFTEEVNADIFGDVLEDADDFGEQFRLFLRHKLSVYFLGQNTGHFIVVLFNGGHGLFHKGGLVGIIRSVVDGIVICLRRQIETTNLDGNLLHGFFHTGAFEFVITSLNFLLVLLVKDVGITQENQTKDRLSVFIGSQVCARTKYIRGMPEIILQLLQFFIGHVALPPPA